LYVSWLRLSNFRNFEQAEFCLDEFRTAVCGDNARGKSNLLEALFFLAIGRSGRGARDRDVVRWGASFYSIEARVEREDGALPIRIVHDARLGKKRAFLEEQPLPRLSALLGAFNAVLFSPEDVDLVLRDPPQRRRILDILVSQCSASYLSDLEVYRRALSQRNRLLRDLHSGRLSRPDDLSPWDYQLAETGARIIAARTMAIGEAEPSLREYYAQIADGGEGLGVVYRPSVDLPEGPAAVAALAGALAQRRADEIALGHTGIGPHRDNLVFQLDGRDAHRFASKGQLKSVMLAWRLAEAAFLESRTGRRPVMLMDDVFSELDRKRAEALLGVLSTFGQTVLTSARDPDLDLASAGYERVEL